jgi:hypothetical protein
MPSEGVRRTLHQVMAKSDSDLRSRSRHLCIEPLRLFLTPELCGAVHSPVDAFNRHLGVELEWMPTDLECFSQDRRRYLQTTLRHEAPSTNQIRSHVDDQAVRGLRNSVCNILNHV